MSRMKTSVQKEDAHMAEAVRAIHAEWHTATRALVNIGQVVLDACFDGNAQLLLEAGAARSARYEELVRRVGALGIGLGEKTLNVALRIAAYDHLVRGNHWKLLDPGRKEDLLPLREPNLLAQGAKFAVEMGSTRENLRKWVAQKRVRTGAGPKLRGMGFKGTKNFVERLECLNDEKTLDRLEKDIKKAGAVEKKKFLVQLQVLREGIAQLEKRLKH